MPDFGSRGPCRVSIWRSADQRAKLRKDLFGGGGDLQQSALEPSLSPAAGCSGSGQSLPEQQMRQAGVGDLPVLFEACLLGDPLRGNVGRQDEGDDLL